MVKEIISRAEQDCAPVFARIDRIEQTNTRRVLEAFHTERVSDRHFVPTCGYGYSDTGRDTLDKLFAHALFCEDALVRPQIASGTHALYLCLDGLLDPSDTLLFATGAPYDTLKTAIDNPLSFKRCGINTTEIPLNEGKLDVAAVTKAVEADPSVKIVYVQRSRGYEWRDSLLPREMKPLFDAIRKLSSDIVIVVDNCYGEFTQEDEPSVYGADVLIGSLIKNPGGGFAPTGGYIAGRTDLVERVAQKLTAPGIGREVGSYAASYLPFYQGLFMAPHTTAQALKTACLFARVFELMGLESMPRYDAERSDIVQALRFSEKQSLIDFCVCIQACAPIDSFVVPEPWDMPGYFHQVIMAAGTFVQGSSIELTADAPIVEPYTAYIQGALTYAHGRLAVERVLNTLVKE